jgi:hypothetical protein
MNSLTQQRDRANKHIRFDNSNFWYETHGFHSNALSKGISRK